MSETNCRIVRWRPKGAPVWSEILPERPLASKFMEHARVIEAWLDGREPRMWAIVVSVDARNFNAGWHCAHMDLPPFALPAVVANVLLREMLERAEA